MFTDHMHQDIARSSYADMLNDDERNRAYNNAIEASVAHLVTSKVFNPRGDRFFRCCDIGTGSGLLSMMIVRSFKKLNYDKFHVQAFEAFQPMADCAMKVIEHNGMSQHITVIPCRSDLYNSQTNPRFDLLVAELLDTELIGEGCLETYRHAIQNLCSPDCLFVPHAARIYLEPVASTRLFSRHAIDNLSFHTEAGHVRMEIPDPIKNCPGMPELDDMQVSALKENEDFTRFSRPQVVFEFLFGNLNSLKLSDHKRLEFKIEKEINEPPVMIMWWDLLMYDSSVTGYSSDQYSWQVLSCAPTWARSAELLLRDQFIRDTYGRDVWREHWIQGVYYLSSVQETRACVGYRPLAHSEPLVIHAYHDTYSLWFDLRQCETKLPPNCECGVHRRFSRSQLASLSDSSLMVPLIQSTLQPHCSSQPTNNPRDVTPISGDIEFLRQDDALGDMVLPCSYGPKWRIQFAKSAPWSVSSEHQEKVSSFLTDPVLAGEIPWSNMMTKYLDITDGGKLPEPVESFDIKFTQVQFDNLNRIRTNVHECEGFNLGNLDDMINYSSKYVDKELEAHFLWEYPCTRIDQSDYTVFSSTSQSSRQDRDKINSGTFWQHYSLPICFNNHQQPQDEQMDRCSWQKGWALVFWAELRLKHTNEILSLGKLRPQVTRSESSGQHKLGERLEWNRNCKQLVYFLHDHPIVAPRTVSKPDDQLTIQLDVGLDRCQLMVQRAVDYNTSPLKSKWRQSDSN